MEEEAREGFTELTGVVGLFVGNKRFLERFQYWFEKDLISNQLTIVTVGSSSMNEEYEVTPILEIPVGAVYL